MQNSRKETAMFRRKLAAFALLFDSVAIESVLARAKLSVTFFASLRSTA